MRTAFIMGLIIASTQVAGDPMQARLEAAVRAGETAEINRVISEMAAQKPPLSKAEASAAADFLIGREQWALARRFVDQLPQAEPGWGYLLVRQLTTEAAGDKARLAELEAWLVQRAKTNREYWTAERRRFVELSGGNLVALFDGLEAELRAHPTDLEGVRVYLEVLGADPRPVTWVARLIKPPLAWDTLQLAEWLGQRHPLEALAVLDRNVPFTKADELRIRAEMRQRSWAMPVIELKPAALYRAWVNELRVACYQASHQNEKAQAILIALAKEGSPSVAFSRRAGEIQAATPTHPLEQHVLEAEPANASSPSYWSGRASYYRGRGDVAHEREALLRAVELTPVTQASPEADVSARQVAMRDWLEFLARTEGTSGAVARLWQEYDAVDLPKLHQWLLQLMLQDYERDDTRYLTPDDARLWVFLERQPKWGFVEEKLLWKMARNASPEQRLAVWSKAEAAVKRQPARAFTVGWVMNRTEAAARSVPLLTLACVDPTDEARQKSACFTLFESHLTLNAWQAAESAWPKASRQLNASEMPRWLGSVALAAARSGALDDAVRIWAKKDALDLAELGLLEELKRTGARQGLVMYYTSMQRERPTSSVPARALAILKSD